MINPTVIFFYITYSPMSDLCQYKDALGKPREGLHAYRVSNFAAVDILLTIVLAVIVSWLTNIGILASTVGLIVLATILHLLFCVKTQLTHNVLQLI